MTFSRTAGARRAAAIALVAMWVIEEFKVFGASGNYVNYAGMVAFCAYFLVALSSALPSQRWVIVAVSATAIAIAAFYRIPRAVLSGIESAVLFAAFLGTMQMLRVALETSPLMGQLRSDFAVLAARQRHDSTLVRAHFIASVLGAGALAVLAPFIGPDEPERDRRGFAQSALQGIGLAVLWSPFFVAMAVSTRFVRDVGLTVAVANGLAMACLGLILSHILYGGSNRLSVLASMRRTVVEVAVLAAGILLANRIGDFSSLEAVVLGVPFVSLWIARGELREGPARTATRWFSSLESIAVEALVVGAALILGEVFDQLLVRGLIVLPHGAENLPTPVLLILPSILMLGTSLLGVHPIVSASCLLPMLTSISKLHGSMIIGSVLLGWMLCVMLSSFVVPVMYAATVFGVRQRELVLGVNLRFCALFVPVAIIYLWLGNTLLQHGI